MSLYIPDVARIAFLESKNNLLTGKEFSPKDEILNALSLEYQLNHWRKYFKSLPLEKLVKELINEFNYNEFSEKEALLAELISERI